MPRYSKTPKKSPKKSPKKTPKKTPTKQNTAQAPPKPAPVVFQPPDPKPDKTAAEKIIIRLINDNSFSRTKNTLINDGEYSMKSRLITYYIPPEYQKNIEFLNRVFTRVRGHFIDMNQSIETIIGRLNEPENLEEKNKVLRGQLSERSPIFEGIPRNILNSEDSLEYVMNSVQNILKVNDRFEKKSAKVNSKPKHSINSNFSEEERNVINSLAEHPETVDYLIQLKQAPDFDTKYHDLGLDVRDKELLKSIASKLSITNLKSIILERIRKKDIEKDKEINPDAEKQKIKKLKKLMNTADTELQRKKLQQKINKLKEVKQQKQALKYINDLTDDLTKKLTLESNPITSYNLSSYIPKKTIPLYVRNKDGPGYHRITPAEITALKNDPSGDYYEGEGVKYRGFYPMGFKVDKNGFFHH